MCLWDCLGLEYCTYFAHAQMRVSTVSLDCRYNCRVTVQRERGLELRIDSGIDYLKVFMWCILTPSQIIIIHVAEWLHASGPVE